MIINIRLTTNECLLGLSWLALDQGQKMVDVHFLFFYVEIVWGLE